MSFPVAGQVSVTGSAVPLSAAPVGVVAFSIKAPQSNANPVFIGPPGVTTSTGFQLDPGDTVDYERLSQNGQPFYQIGPNDVYACGTSPDKVTWLASPGG